MKKTDNIILWSLIGAGALCFIYIFAVTFLPVPKANQRFADTSLGVILGGILTGIVSNLKQKLFPGEEKKPAPEAPVKPETVS